MKHTPERYTIMAAACRLQHFTIDELRAALTELSISRATIYNTLSLLEDARLVQKLDKEFGVRTAQYEWMRDSESSVQVVCTKCGRVSPVKDSTISRMLADKRWSNFVPHHFSLYVTASFICFLTEPSTSSAPSNLATSSSNAANLLS